MATRSRLENKQLGHTVRVNGQTMAAFRHYADAEDLAYVVMARTNDARVEIIDNDGTMEFSVFGAG